MVCVAIVSPSLWQKITTERGEVAMPAVIEVSRICRNCVFLRGDKNCHEGGETVFVEISDTNGCAKWKARFVQVMSIEHLKQLCSDTTHDFRLQLMSGLFSRKLIEYYEGKFSIENCIDSSHCRLSDKQLADPKRTHIPEAITKGAFWMEVEE